MIDTHAHLNFPGLAENVDEIIARAGEAGIEKIIIPGVDQETSASALALALRYPNIYAMAGVHPTAAESSEGYDYYEKVFTAHPNQMVAIGEVGLDYYRLSEEEGEAEKQKTAQFQRLEEFTRLAKKVSVPLVIHSRNCFSDLHPFLSTHAKDHPTVIHCFSGTYEEAVQWLDLGYNLSFTGMITFPKNEELRNVVAKVPRDRIMVETDAPFLAPQKYRGKLCEPAYVREVTACVATLWETSFEEVDRITTLNTEQFFRLN